MQEDLGTEGTLGSYQADIERGVRTQLTQAGTTFTSLDDLGAAVFSGNFPYATRDGEQVFRVEYHGILMSALGNLGKEKPIETSSGDLYRFAPA